MDSFGGRVKNKNPSGVKMPLKVGNETIAFDLWAKFLFSICFFEH